MNVMVILDCTLSIGDLQLNSFLYKRLAKALRQRQRGQLFETIGQRLHNDKHLIGYLTKYAQTRSIDSHSIFVFAQEYL